MKRRTLDIMFSTGGLVLAGLLLIVGVVLTSNANFANNYVATQLSQQNITFKTLDTLTAEEKQSSCLLQYAGQKLTTGKQAECYAKGGLVPLVVAGAQKTNDPNLANLQKQLTTITAQRDTLFKGETLRGLLLTSYGFSVFGDKAGQGALVAYLAALLLALLSIAQFTHAVLVPRTRTFAAAEPNRIPATA